MPPIAPTRYGFDALTRRRLVAAAALGLMVATLPAMPAAAFEPNSTAAVNLDDGVAIKGHDPVAYFTQGAAVAGDPSLTAAHDGATYRFASADNLAAFQADPARYAPAYGGFCAYGAAYGSKIDVDPEAFAIVDDRLYLNVSKRINRRWSQDVDARIDEANENWPRIRNTAPAAL